MNDLSDQLNEYLEKLPKRAVIDLLVEALDEMQSYNGQSKTSAICRAIGDGTRWKLPPISRKKIFG